MRRGKFSQDLFGRFTQETTDWRGIVGVLGSLESCARQDASIQDLRSIGNRTMERMVDLVGIEPTTSSMPWKRAPSCATGPLDDGSFHSRPGNQVRQTC